MEDTWKKTTPRGTVEYTITGSNESGFIYFAQLEGNDIRHQQIGTSQLSRPEVEKLFADDFKL
jgi:hypothetical protein